LQASGIAVIGGKKTTPQKTILVLNDYRSVREGDENAVSIIQLTLEPHRVRGVTPAQVKIHL
jgi:hypothetical protein